MSNPIAKEGVSWGDPAIAPAGPTDPNSRAIEIDILRGFALFGVLVVNFQSPTMGGFANSSTNVLDSFGHWLVKALFDGRFYPLFSLLFGLGVSMQLLRAQSSGRSFVRPYARRLLILYLLGLLHGLLVWQGDVLHTYALAGILFLPVRRFPPRLILILTCAFLAASTFFLPVFTALRGRSAPAQAEGAGRNVRVALDERSKNKFLENSYGQMVRARWVALIKTYFGSADAVAFKLSILSMFFLGLYVGRCCVGSGFAADERLMRQCMWWALGLTCFFAAWEPLWQGLSALLRSDTPWVSRLFHLLTGYTMTAITRRACGPLLSIVYATGLLLLLQKADWLARLRPLAAVGRLSLSNYLLISIIGTTLFYGYGLGLYGKLGYAAGMILALFLYGIQLILSNCWLKRFQFGPAEWLWRSLTYARFQPLRLQSS